MSVHSNTNLIGLGETAKLPPPFFVLPMDSLGGFAPPPLGIPRSVFHGLDFEPYMKNVALLFGHFKNLPILDRSSKEGEVYLVA